MEENKSFPLELAIELEITEEDIDDIMAAALEGGISFWCARVDVKGEYLGEYASEQISRGGTLRIYDGVGDVPYDLNRESFIRGLERYLESPNYETLYFDSGKYKVDTGSIDSCAADCIIQYALFDEIVYS